MSAALARAAVVFAPSAWLFCLFHLHLDISELLGRERYAVLLFKLAQHMLCVAFLGIDLTALYHLLDLLNQD